MAKKTNMIGEVTVYGKRKQGTWADYVDEGSNSPARKKVDREIKKMYKEKKKALPPNVRRQIKK